MRAKKENALCQDIRKAMLKIKKSRFRLFFMRLLRLGFHNDFAVVGTALLAHAVGKDHSAALGASGQRGKRKLPMAGSSLISARLRLFSLRNCHSNYTSLVG